MESLRINAGASTLFCWVAGTSQGFLSNPSSWLQVAVQVATLVSLVLLSLKHWRDLRRPKNETL